MRRPSGLVLAAVGLVAVGSPGCNEEDTITAPALSATCSANPSEGAAPLEVSFALDISGAEGPASVRVSYGDGTNGTDPDAIHTYGEAGLYTASFDVTTTSQSARCATSVNVSPGTAAGSPPSDGNQPPNVTFKTRPKADEGEVTGTAPLEVLFNMCLTADPEDDKLYFTMDLDGDGKLDVRGSTGASCRERWTYAAGTWHPIICATDLDPGNERLHPFQCQEYTVVAS
jgi:PKD repeat protein